MKVNKVFDLKTISNYEIMANREQRNSLYSHVLYLSGIKLHRIDSNTQYVEIAYHGNKKQERIWHQIATSMYPEWEDSWSISDYKSEELRQLESSELIADKIIFASSFNASFNTSDSNCFSVPLGPIKKLVSNLGEKNQIPTFCFIGNLGLRKGVPLILDVAPKIEAIFEIAGNGSRDSIKRIQNKKIENLKLFDNPNNQEICEILSRSHAFILPSFYEGFGIAILEAMSYGCIPIVSMNTCGIDILKGSDIENFLFSAGNMTSFEKALKTFLALSPSEKLYLSSQSSEISKKYTMEKYAMTTVNELFK